MADSVRPHRRQPTRLPRPWDSPGKNTGVGCHFLLQCMKVESESRKSLGRVRLSMTPWIAAYQAPPSMGFSRQEYWSGVPLPSPMLPWYSSTAWILPRPQLLLSAVDILFGARETAEICREALLPVSLGLLSLFRMPKALLSCQTRSPILFHPDLPFLSAILILCLLSIPQGRALAHHLNCKSKIWCTLQVQKPLFSFLLIAYQGTEYGNRYLSPKAYSHLIKEDTKRHQGKQKGSLFPDLNKLKPTLINSLAF